MEFNGKNILFAVLNWGLGHATRSADLIQQLTENNEVSIASDGDALKYLREKFPDLPAFETIGYNIKYSTSPSGFNLLINGLKTQKAVSSENKWLNNHLKSHNYDIIISDNRYGFYAPNMRSIVITHQIQIKVPFGERMVNRKNHLWLNNFNEIWIPDFNHQLSGTLSRPFPKLLKGKIKEIGWLSRFKHFREIQSAESHIVAVVSGPEPQKSILFNNLKNILEQLNHPSILYSGTIKNVPPTQHGLLTVKHHNSDLELWEDLNKAKLIISRPGYTSLMDYQLIKKPLLLIPTPGQTEQEYLGKYLKSKPHINTIQQKDLWDFNFSTYI